MKKAAISDMKKRRVLILFGGRSVEHEVSLLSARNVYLALDRDRFEPVLIAIDKQGRWTLAGEKVLLEAIGDPHALGIRETGEEFRMPVHPAVGPSLSAAPASSPAPILDSEDVVFPVLHGTYGEDGTVQGLLELADAAYVGSGHLGSAIGMDKEVSKRLLIQAGIPVVPYRLITADAWRTARSPALARAAELGFPCFVKPANAGSSVGVSKVKAAADLEAAIANALAYDRKVLVETGVDAREIECAVLGNDEPEASAPGEIVVDHKDGFYSYEAKYVDASASRCAIPAEIPPETAARVRALSLETFRALELAGMARVDFFLDRKTGELFVNEVNTLPGFTALSMYPKLWEAQGLDPKALTTRLVDLALERRAGRRALRTGL
jgi:D-alanine-D-alanine ligase